MDPATLTSVAANDATPSGPDTILLHVQEDAYQGDAQYTIAVDGAQVGGVRTETAQAQLGQSEAVTLNSTFGAGPHKVAVTFLNDAYGGSAATDRNLYVADVSYNGTAVPGAAAALYQNGTAAISIPAASPAPTAATPDASRSTVDPAFASPSAGNYRMSGGAGIGFASIDQTQIGLAPAGPHPY